MNAARQRAAIICAALLAAPTAICGELPPYRSLVPAVSVQLSSLSDAVRLLNDGLSGIGVETTASDCSRRIAEALMLPSLEGADMAKPVHGFLLTRDPPAAAPEPAVILPIRTNGAKDLLRSLQARYSFVEGGNIKICSGPLEDKFVEPLYVAIAEGNAMISPDIEAIRWMAYNLQSRTVPEVPSFRGTPFLASVNSTILCSLLELIGSTAPASTTQKDAATTAPDFGEARSFLSSFSHIDLALGASIKQLDVAVRLTPRESATATAFRNLPPPADKLTAYFPPFSCNNAASALPGFMAALPQGVRQWFAELADNTRLVGFQILPAAFDLDERIRPFTSGISLASFVVDRPGGRIGAVSIYALTSPDKANAALRGYFAGNGEVARNRRIQNPTLKRDGQVIAYDLGESDMGKTSASGGNAGASLSQLFDLNHVELAVRDDRLIVTRGSSRLMGHWLDEKPASSWSGGVSSMTGIFTPQSGETVLGGGSLEPVFLARKIVEVSPSISYLAPKMPHAGNGIAWRMSRNDGDVIFDVRLYSNEILAINTLHELDSSTMQELLSQLVLRHFRLSIEGETRHDVIRDMLKQFGGK